MTFVNERPRIERACQTAKLQQRRMARLEQSSQQLFHRHQKKSVAATLAHGLNGAVPLTAFKDNLFISFLVSRMFEGRAPCLFDYGTDDGATSSSGWWVAEMMKTPSKPLDALATTYFARSHGLHDAVTGGLKLYGEAILDLRDALLDANSVWGFETLAATTALCMLEVQSTLLLLPFNIKDNNDGS